MDFIILPIDLSSYPPLFFSFLYGTLFVIAVVLPAYVIYRLITWKLNLRGRMFFNSILIMSGFLFGTLFFIEITLTLITEHQVNKQLGFGYATPETPEGEFFIITKVVPDGIMDKAGLKPDDRVLMNSTLKLYKLLIKNQGGEADFQILRDNTEVTIRLKIPAMELPLRRVVVWF